MYLQIIGRQAGRQGWRKQHTAKLLNENSHLKLRSEANDEFDSAAYCIGDMDGGCECMAVLAEDIANCHHG